MRARCTMRTGSRRNVCAIAFPGDAGADRPSPIGSSTAACLVVSPAPDDLLAAAIALAFCRSPAMRSR